MEPRQEIGVSPRVKDALGRAFAASCDLGHSYVGPEHLLIGLAEEDEGVAGTMLRRLGLTPPALRQQDVKVVGRGAEEGRVERPTNTPNLDKYSRDLTALPREGKLDPIIGRARQDELVLFIDEVHTIVGAGEGGLDIADVFKPALARGELNLIGSTTLNEYQKHIEKDAALERRFQPVLVP